MIDMPREPSHPERFAPAPHEQPFDLREVSVSSDSSRAHTPPPNDGGAFKLEEPGVPDSSPIPPTPPEDPPRFGDESTSLSRPGKFFGLESPQEDIPGLPDCDTRPARTTDEPLKTDDSETDKAVAVSPETAYDTAVQALRNRGKYRGDAHYAYADVSVVTPGGDVPGRVTIKDYHSYESKQFEVRPGGAGSDPEEQARLLETGKAVIGISLACHTKDPAIRLPFYTLIEPANIRPDLGLGPALEDEGAPPSEWQDGEFVITRTVEKDTEYLEYDTRIMTNEEDINSDPQLVEIMKVLRGMAKGTKSEG